MSTNIKAEYPVSHDTGLQSGIPLQTEHTYTHHMLCCRITTLSFYIFSKILKSVTLIRNIRAPWGWFDWDRNMLERF